MTARISLIAAVFAVFILSCDTERNIAPVFETYFTKYYGEDGNQYGVDLALGSDGTFVMLGRSESQTNSVTRSFIVKTDGNGVVLWERQLDGNNEVPVDVEIDSRNDILVVSNITGDSVRITRINQSGAEIGSTVIAYKDDDGNMIASLIATAVTETSDGSLLLTGYAGPELVSDGDMPPPDDVQDLLIYKVDPDFAIEPKMSVTQGGEHFGKIVKIFESQQSGPLHYYSFGDSDRPFKGNGYRQAFEVNMLNEFFVATPADLGPVGDVQISRDAIEMPVAGQRGYVMVGSSGPESSRQVIISQYIDGPKLSLRLAKTILTPRSTEGISVAYGEQDTMFVLADEKQDNNNHDIYLVKLDREGQKIGDMRFGSIEGDDRAAAVRVLPDQRVAVFGTIELVTQKKMMLTLVSPQGTFSE